MIGIYKITNKINNKKYIGSSEDIQKRWEAHKNLLDGNYHPNRHLQNTWNKYSEENFEFEIIMLCHKSLLFRCEQWFLDNIIRWEHDYNIATTAEGGSGKLTKETKEKIGKSNMGKTHSKEAKMKISKNNARYWLGKHHTEETKEKMRRAKSGEKSIFAKLSMEDVINIRKEYNGEWGQQTQLAEKYNVSCRSIQRIINRKTWRYI